MIFVFKHLQVSDNYPLPQNLPPCEDDITVVMSVFTTQVGQSSQTVFIYMFFSEPSFRRALPQLRNRTAVINEELFNIFLVFGKHSIGISLLFIYFQKHGFENIIYDILDTVSKGRYF